MKAGRQIALFSLAGLLAIGVVYAIGERSGRWNSQSSVIDFAASICSAVIPGAGDAARAEIAVDGWKSLANWKKLAKDMSITDVPKILGEPERVNGGTIAYWYYPNGGTVTFFIGKVDNWSEPKPVAANRP